MVRTINPEENDPLHLRYNPPMNKLRNIFPIILMFFWQPVLADEMPMVTVYKTPTCGCCGRWIDHMEENGFQVSSENIDDVGPIKQENGVPPELRSCHTAIVAGYVIEGHVPAEDVFKLLREKPDVVGISVPGMPIGSPGMEGPNAQPYRVLSFDRNGDTKEYSVHTP